MADAQRSIYFYKAELATGEWRRAEVLRGLDALTGDDQVMSLGDDNYAWAKVDQVPQGNGFGRLRLFRDRRAGLPGMSDNGVVSDLPIPDTAGLVEPTHVVLGGDGLIAAEYNHFAPRIQTQFARLLRSKLGLEVTIGTYVQGSVYEQLDRMESIRLFEMSVVATPELEEELRNAGPFGNAAASVASVDGGKRINMRLTGERDSQTWTETARTFAKRVFGMPGAHEGHSAKVLRVTGYDPVADGEETVDLLKHKLVRRASMERASARSKALDDQTTYDQVEQAVREVRQNDLQSAALVF